MQVEARNVGMYKNVAITVGSTRVELGLLNDTERDDLAVDMINGAWEMYNGAWGLGPSANNAEWLLAIIKKCGIELPKPTLYCLMSEGVCGKEPLYDSETGAPSVYVSREKAEAEVDLMSRDEQTEAGYSVLEFETDD